MSDPNAGAVDPRSRLTSRTAQHLAAALGRLRLDDLPAKGATRVVTRATIAWAESLNWLPVPEMALGWLEVVGPDGPEERLGVVDLFIARPGYRSDLVIEIDRGNKLWSARKLGLAASRGDAAIWIRWGRPGSIADIELAAGVELIVLQARMPPRVDRITASIEPVFSPRPARPHLTGPALALLATLLPDGPRAEDAAWSDEAELWRMVDEIDPRLAFIVRARFGARSGRPLTLTATAEALAEDLGTKIVSRERIRQLERKALIRLRSKWTLAARPPTPKDAPAGSARPRSAPPEPADIAELPQLIRDVIVSGPPRGMTATVITHILRGSPGPHTRGLIDAHGLPHDGALRRIAFASIRPEILGAARKAGLHVEGDRVTED